MFFVEERRKNMEQTTQAIESGESVALPKKFVDASFLHGVALGNNPQESKVILESLGYSITKPADMADAVADLATNGGDKWATFTEQFKPLLEKTIEAEMRKKSGESNATGAEGAAAGGGNPISAIATAVGNIVGGITGVMASSKNRDAAKEGAKGELYKGMLGVIQEKEKRKSAKQNQIIWVVVGLVVVIIVFVIAYVIMNKKKEAK